jgi:hypothetical protein
MNGFETILPFLKPIEHLLLDPSISEVMVNGSDHIFIEKDGFVETVQEEVPRVEDSLDHARTAFAVVVPSFRSGADCCCLRQRRKSASLQSTILSAELTT